MPPRTRAPTSVRACRRSFEPARLQQQLRSEAYAHLVPGRSPGRSPAEESAGRDPPDRRPALTTSANPCGGICA